LTGGAGCGPAQFPPCGPLSRINGSPDGQAAAHSSITIARICPERKKMGEIAAACENRRLSHG